MSYRSMRLVLTSIAVIALAGCGDNSNSKSANTPSIRFVTIGTGGITGVYYPTGGAIARTVNQQKERYGLRCTVESTGGSVFNINAVLRGDLELGIAQSDRQYQAVNGLAEWKEAGPQPKLRALFSIHNEAVTLVAAADTGIASINDLRGKRVNIGNPGSGQRQNAIDALVSAEIDYTSDLRAENVKAAEAPSLLQDGQIDAFFYTVGHPSGAIKEATSGHRKVRIIPIPDVVALTEKYPYYAKCAIADSHYPSAVDNHTVPSFGVKATVVTSSDVPDDIIYAITREVFENLDSFKKLHPAYSSLTKESMMEGLTAPLHPGALRYFHEAQLIDADASTNKQE